VTTEDDFQAALDANPDDHQTRLVFADWLQERGDPRAEGYRALGRLRHECFETWFNASAYPDLVPYDRSNLPEDWFCLLEGYDVRTARCRESAGNWRDFATRRAAEDAAALAFARLPPERRAELLAGPSAKS
jgi:uncharacterized protein (TIGR02996 family)